MRGATSPDVFQWHARLSPYYGKRIRVTMNGEVRQAGAHGARVVKRTYLQRDIDLREYGDFFGPGSVYYRLAKSVRDRASNEALYVSSMTIEILGDIPGYDRAETLVIRELPPAERQPARHPKAPAKKGKKRK